MEDNEQIRKRIFRGIFVDVYISTYFPYSRKNKWRCGSCKKIFIEDELRKDNLRREIKCKSCSETNYIYR